MESSIGRLMGLWNGNTDRASFLITGELQNYESVASWLVVATEQADATVINSEPVGCRDDEIPKWARRDNGVGGRIELEESMARWNSIYFANHRSERLLSETLEAQGFRSATDHQRQGRVVVDLDEILKAEDRFLTFLSQGGSIRLSMKRGVEVLAGREGLHSPSFDVRRYAPEEDGPSLTRLYRWYDGTQLDLEEWNHGWEAHHTLVVEGAPCGICGFCLFFSGDLVGLQATCGIIGDIYMDARFRGMGGGSVLLLSALGELSSCRETRLGVNLLNTGAYRFFTRAGFTVDSAKLYIDFSRRSYTRDP